MAEPKSSRRHKDREGLANIFRDERHGGRLPNILEPTEPAAEPEVPELEPASESESPPPELANPPEIEPEKLPEPSFYEPDALASEPRRRGARLDKKSGLHLVC